jgi:hypothetical protein
MWRRGDSELIGILTRRVGVVWKSKLWHGSIDDKVSTGGDGVMELG